MLKVFKKGQCLACHSEKSGCKIDLSSGFILCRGNVTSVPGYRYTGRTKDDGWDMWTPGETATPRDKESQLKQELKRIEEAHQRRIKLNGMMSAVERDRDIKKIASRAGLSQKHRKDLQQRGLTNQQIDARLFASIDYSQNWQGILDSRFPGLSTSGRLSVEGLFIPAFDANGHAIGGQVKLDDPNKIDEFGKYLWLSSQKTNSAHTKEGELPLTVCKPDVVAESGVLGLCEGILKPAIAAQRLNTIFIGASGGNFASSEKQLIAAIEKHKPTKVVFFPDAGSPLNDNVLRQIENAIAIAQGVCSQVEIAWWGQVDKGFHDCDELDAEDRGRLRYITVKEFWKIVGRAKYDDRVKAIQKQLRSLTNIDQTLTDVDLVKVKGDLKLDVKKLAKEMPEYGMFYIRAPKGIGKSELMAYAIARYKRLNMSILSLTNSRPLSAEQARRLGLENRLDIKEEYAGVKGAKGLGKTALNNAEHLTMCLDSVYQMEGRIFDVVILDEIEQEIEHLNSSETLKFHRTQCMTVFENIIKNAKVVIGLDADLTDVSINHIKRVRGIDPLPCTIIDVKKTPVVREISLVGKNDDQVVDRVIDALGKDENVVLPTDSQGKGEAIEKMILKLYPDKIVRRIDRDTNRYDQATKDYLANINESIAFEKPDLLIYSPTIRTGVSIDFQHFDLVAGLFYGVIPPSQVRQMMGRVRSTCPMIIYAAKRGIGISRERSSPFPVELREQALTYFDSSTGPIASAYARATGRNIDDVETGKDPALDVHYEMTARANYGKANLYKVLAEEYEAEGHNVIRYDGEQTATAEELKAIKEELQEAESLLIFDSDTEGKDIKDAQRILDAEISTPEQDALAKKIMLEHNFPEFPWTQQDVLDLAVKNHGRILKQVRLDWLRQNPGKCKVIDIETLKKHFENDRQWLPDIRLCTATMQLLSDLRLDDLLTGEDLTSTCHTVVEFMERCQKHRKAIKNCFGLTVRRDDKPIKFINNLLSRFGLKLTCKGQRARVWTYFFDLNSGYPEWKLNLFVSLDTAFERDYPAQETVFNTKQDSLVQPTQPQPKPLYNLRASVSEVFDLSGIAV